MAKYVLSHRRAGMFSSHEKVAAREAAATTFESLFAASADVVGALRPKAETGRQIIVFEASSAEVAAKQAELGPDVLLEPEILHYPDITLPLDVGPGRTQAFAGEVLAGQGRALRCTVRGPGGPLEGAEVLLFLRAAGTLSNMLEARTDPQGKVRFEYASLWMPALLLAIPAGNHWTAIVRGPQDGLMVETDTLPMTGRAAWWHDVLGLTSAPDAAGTGVTVGVADTGLGPHPHLAHAQSVGAFIDGQHHADPDAGLDVASHGTHVAGTIGSRPDDGGRPGGVAPGASLFTARVFPPNAGAGANQGDIVAAIDHLSQQRQADLINLSLGAPRASEIERDGIIDALERGTLCICAAANSAGPVEFPAAFPETVAVSALGREGWAPSDSLSGTRYPDKPDRYGTGALFLANFSCFGPEIDCAAPGVGVIATVPERFGLSAPYAAMDGTSMASPAACGLLAAVLANVPDYLALPRNLSRAHRARQILRESCRDIGLDPVYQGHGIASGATVFG